MGWKQQIIPQLKGTIEPPLLEVRPFFGMTRGKDDFAMAVSPWHFCFPCRGDRAFLPRLRIFFHFMKRGPMLYELETAIFLFTYL